MFYFLSLFNVIMGAGDNDESGGGDEENTVECKAWEVESTDRVLSPASEKRRKAALRQRECRSRSRSSRAVSGV